MDYNSDSSDGFDWKSNARCSAAFQFTKEKDSDSEPDGSYWENTGGRCSAAGPSEHQYGGYSGEASSSAEPSTPLISQLVHMGFSREMVQRSIDLNGENNIDAIMDTLFEFQDNEKSPSQNECLTEFLEDFSDEDSLENEEQKNAFNYYQLKKKRPDHKKRKEKIKQDSEEVDKFAIPKLMIGYGVPGYPCVHHTWIPDEALRPPYFYYENVANATKGTWPRISKYLFNIQPEFVNSQYFSAASRPRGYIHNLPIGNRTQLMPTPPLTIFEAFPNTRVWWPSWDLRTQLNCLLTKTASSLLINEIHNDLEMCNSDPSPALVRKIMDKCKSWNLLWVGKNRVAALEPSEMELLMGFPKNHTSGISYTARLEGLGNAFQVDTVAYHLSVLKKLYPCGITVLSLFSGIGGAEVALHRLGIYLKTVVSVEISKPRRDVLRTWWNSTNQTGNLIEIDDVVKLSNERLESLTYKLGGFDLIIGGSPCNNLSGSNRSTRSGLEGDQSSLFFEYPRILKQVKATMDGLSRASR